MTIAGRDPRRQNRKRRPFSQGRIEALKLLQKRLGRETAELQLFIVDEMPGMPRDKRMVLEKVLREKHVLGINGELKDLETIVARAVQLSADMKVEASTREAKHRLPAVQRGILVTAVNVALSTIMEAKEEGII